MSAPMYNGQPINPRLMPCFVCQKRGFQDVQIRLAGHTPEGYPVRIEATQNILHKHRGTNTTSGQSQQGGTNKQTEDILMAVTRSYEIINNKLDTIIKYLGADPLNDDGDSSRESPQEDDRSNYE